MKSKPETPEALAGLTRWKLWLEGETGLVRFDPAPDGQLVKFAEVEALLQRQERCICAAVKMGELVIRGHRHDDCLRNLKARKLDPEPITQGFVTSTNRFVSREEAMQIQRAVGAKSCYSQDGELHGDILFSEDLY